MQEAPWVDIAMLLALAASVVVGLLRGFTYELMSLAGWVVAFLCARFAGPAVMPLLSLGAQGSGLNVAAAYACVFIAALLAWGLLSWAVKKLVQASPLNAADRMLGGAFGALRALLLLVVVAALVMLTPAVASAAWRQSMGASALSRLIEFVKPMLPPEFARFLGAPAATQTEQQGV
ncbi:MAG TPA: CvpA family protein [Burkholderiaceae bacterium]|nr:CvpA family protein [Burkholderiaceae bacterium]